MRENIPEWGVRIRRWQDPHVPQPRSDCPSSHPNRRWVGLSKVQSSSSVLRFRSNSQDQLKRNRYYRLVRWMERRLHEQHRYWHALPAVSLLPPICPVESPSARRVIRRTSPLRFSGPQIGRASWRARVCQYGSFAEVAVYVEKKI